MEMNYFNPFYPFPQAIFDSFAYCIPHYPFEPFLAESIAEPAKEEKEIKIEETAPKK